MRTSRKDGITTVQSWKNKSGHKSFDGLNRAREVKAVYWPDATLSWIQFHNFLLRTCPQRSSGLLGTGSPGRPRRLSRSCWALKNMSALFCLSRDPLLTCANKSGTDYANPIRRKSFASRQILNCIRVFFSSSIKGKSSLSFLLKGNRTENISLARKRRKSANIFI